MGWVVAKEVKHGGVIYISGGGCGGSRRRSRHGCRTGTNSEKSTKNLKSKDKSWV